MTQFVTTAAGARIAYDREGAGRPLILIGGAGQFRAVDEATRDLTTELATRGFDVVHYDRPGRGDSGGEPPFDLAGEVSAISALVELLGGRAALYGSSSGGVIALAAAGGLPGVDRLVLWEVPLGEEEGADGAEFLAAVQEPIDAGDREGTLRAYMADMPPAWFDGMRHGPRWPQFERMAPTVWSQSAPRAQLWGGISAPTIVLVGTTTFPFMSDAADAIVAALPDARRASVPGADHGWQPSDMADSIAGSAR